MANYTVKRGDNLSSIAKKNGLTLNQLLKLNPQIKDSSLIGVGDIITLTKPGPQTSTNKNLSKKEEYSDSGELKQKSYYIPWKPTIQKGQQCGVDGCAQYANDTLRKHKDKKGRILYTYDNIGGHAWTRLLAGKNSKMIYSGYDSEDYDKTKFSNTASDQRNFKAADKLLKEFNSKTLDPNKVYMVNMFYKGSPSRKQAWEEAIGGTTGTHTGNLYFNKDTNRWHVSHNIHGTVYDDDFIKIQGSRGKYGVTANIVLNKFQARAILQSANTLQNSVIRIPL